jgi:hypothetical protein
MSCFKLSRTGKRVHGKDRVRSRGKDNTRTRLVDIDCVDCRHGKNEKNAVKVSTQHAIGAVQSTRDGPPNASGENWTISATSIGHVGCIVRLLCSCRAKRRSCCGSLAQTVVGHVHSRLLRPNKCFALVSFGLTSAQDDKMSLILDRNQRFEDFR